MATTNCEKLFAEFPEVSTEAWEAAIAVDLKGADYERKLVWRTTEGFNLRPYYRAENLEGLETLGTQAGEFPYLRGVSGDNSWLTHQTVTVKCPKEANATALKMLEAYSSPRSSSTSPFSSHSRYSFSQVSSRPKYSLRM